MVKMRPIDIYIWNKYILVLNFKIGVISTNWSGSIQGKFILGSVGCIHHISIATSSNKVYWI